MNEAYRKAIRSLWKGSTVIYTQVKQQNPTTKRTEFTEVTTGQSFPCRVSYKSTSTAESTDTGNKVSQTLVLFIGNEVEIPAGSKLAVTQNGFTVDYSRSGEPAMYSNHQEIQIEPFKGWA